MIIFDFDLIICLHLLPNFIFTKYEKTFISVHDCVLLRSICAGGATAGLKS